jgi:heme exporter protein A
MVETDSVLEAQELSRFFGRHHAVKDVTFALSRGESLALFGPNGAGKTTVLRLLAGLLRPTSGRAEISGSDIRTDVTLRGRIGLISHQSMLYPALTALENVDFAARLHGVPDASRAARRALETMGIAGRASSQVRTLSRGMQQRVSIARAIVHEPAVLLLDEPYTGLDAAGAATLSEMLHRLRAGGATMVLVTHNVPEGLAVASHAAVMLDGRLTRVRATSGIDPGAFTREYRDLVVAGGDAQPMAVAG